MTRTSTLDAISLIAAKSTDGGADEAWAEWVSVAVTGAGGSLWALHPRPPAGGPGPGHTHVIQLVMGTALRRGDGGGGNHAEIRRDDWARHGDPIVTDPSAPVTALIVAEVLCADPDREAEWDRWYDEVHLPDMMACGAFVAGSRWRRAAHRPGGANHLTVYEIAGRSLDQAIEQSVANMPGLVAAGRKHELHTGGLTMALTRV